MNQDSDDRSSLPIIDDAQSAKSLRWLIQLEDTDRGWTANTPAAHLRQRLSEPDGAEWLAKRLRMPPFAPLPDAAAALVEGRASLREIEELRMRCKLITGQTATRDILLAGIAGYFFATAAALLHHHRYASSQPIDDLREILIDLATVLDEPWSSFLSQAAFAEPDPVAR
jgi:hypothetical protein